MHEIGSRANRRQRSNASLKESLARQLKFLRASCEAYDRGEVEEAIRMAVILRVLLHHEGQSKSLLAQLGFQSTMLFVDTGLYRHLLDTSVQKYVDKISPGWVASNIPGEAGLVELAASATGTAHWTAPLRARRFHKDDPRFGGTRSMQPFDSWWNTPLVESSSWKHFSRWHLVKIMANQDGGAHLDPTLDADYEDLNIDFLGTHAAFGPTEVVEKMFQGPDEPPRAEGNVAFASMRQVAFEFLLSMHMRDRPGLFVQADPFEGLPEAGPQPSYSIGEPIVMVLPSKQSEGL